MEHIQVIVRVLKRYLRATDPKEYLKQCDVMTRHVVYNVMGWRTLTYYGAISKLDRLFGLKSYYVI